MKQTRRLRGSFEIRTQTPETLDEALSVAAAGDVRPSPAQQVRDYIADSRQLANAAEPEFKELADEIRVAAATLEERFTAARYADLLTTAAIELTELVCELQTNQSRQMRAGLKTMLGGRKGAQCKGWDSADDFALIKHARQLREQSVQTNCLTRKCIEDGLSTRSHRQTRTVLQRAGLVPTRTKKGK